MLDQQTLEYPHRVNFINNAWAPSSGVGVEALNPADKDDVVGIVPDSTPEDVEAAISAAENALHSWA